MALNLTGVFGDIGNLASGVSAQDVLTGLLTSAAGTVVVSGLQTSGGQNAIDPLHIFTHPGTAASGSTPAAPATAGVVQGAGVMKMSQFIALSPDQQKLIQAMNYTIVPG